MTYFRRDLFARSSASATTTAMANAASARPSTIQNRNHIENPNSACVSVGRSIAPVRRTPRPLLGTAARKPSTIQFTGGPNLGDRRRSQLVSSRRAVAAPILRRAA